LAESLRQEYSGRFATICIFDSREASQRRTDESYPEKELSRHWLVVVDWGGDTGSKEEIRWVAEGRDQQEVNAKAPTKRAEPVPKVVTNAKKADPAARERAR